MFGFDSRCVYERETERKQEEGKGEAVWGREPDEERERRQFDYVN